MISTILGALGYELRRIRLQPEPREAAPREGAPVFQPWLVEDEAFEKLFAAVQPRTVVSPVRCYILFRLAQQARHVEGDLWECGVYRGGTAALFAATMAGWPPERRLVLFDTFEGMPATDAARDVHQSGDFADTSLESVRDFVGHGARCEYRKGHIPETFAGLESARIAMAHVDVDIYRSVMDCLEFIWPRLSPGGFIVLDDYGFPTCPGAKEATDEFFAGKTAVPLALPTRQALVFKGC